MKKVLAASVLLGMTNMAIAADAPQLRHRFTEYATVVDVEPIYKRVRRDTPSTECWIEQEEQVVIREGRTQRFGETRGRSNRRGSYNSDRSNITIDGDSGGAILGAVIGGVIGNQIGRNAGSGARTGATVAGAIAGSVLANEARGSSREITRHRRGSSSRGSSRTESIRTQPERVVTTRPVERCRETTRTSYTQELQAYDVTYKFRGKTFTTRMDNDPGDRIELQVNISPARS